MATPSFLNLPQNIRQKIYRHAGLTRPCPVIIARYAPTSVERSSMERFVMGLDFGAFVVDDEKCLCPELPKQLLLVNKTIYKEALPILYGHNRFVVRAHQLEDIKMLETLSATAVHELRYLLLRLNGSPCRCGYTRRDPNQNYCLGCGKLLDILDAMRGGDDDSENIFHAVGSICRFLGSQIASDRLAFTFICDVKDYTTAKRLLRPFDALPRLKECNIRIGNRRDGALRSLARSTSTAATTDNQTGNTEGMPFPFMKLPRELRIQILQQTDLGGFGKDLDIRDLGLMSKQTTRFKCCGNCTFTKSDCCCPLNFSAQSNSCTCRILPMELFLTNRQMGLDATEVLYSSNNFKFKGNLISFLNIFRGFRHHTLKSFRRISFDFYSTQTTQWMLNHSQYWIETISFIRDNFDVSKLQLSVITTDDSKECKWSNYSERTTVPLYNAYVAITRTVKQQLPHLRDFHVTLGVFFDLEAELERWVMGPDYDSQRGSANRNATGKKSNPVWDISHCKVPRWHKGLGDDD